MKKIKKAVSRFGRVLVGVVIPVSAGIATYVVVDMAAALVVGPILSAVIGSFCGFGVMSAVSRGMNTLLAFS